jgi:hypothetical protein
MSNATIHFSHVFEKCYKQKGKKVPSITYILAEVYKEIGQVGVTTDSTFHEGSMSILFKKGHRERIENYRPLTQSNVDYKLMTKSIATGTLSTQTRLVSY